MAQPREPEPGVRQFRHASLVMLDEASWAGASSTSPFTVWLGPKQRDDRSKLRGIITGILRARGIIARIP